MMGVYKCDYTALTYKVDDHRSQLKMLAAESPIDD